MDRDEEIKNEFIQRAEVERDNLLREIERLTTSVLPGAKQDFENIFSTFIDMARQMNVPFSVDREMENEIEQYINNLLVLKTELEDIEINEDTLLGDTVINKAQQIIPLIEPSIVKAKINLYNSNKNNFLNASKERRDVENKISNLEIQIMYLQGKLDSTWKRSEKIKLGEEINSLKIELNSLKNQLSKLVFKEDVSIPKNNGEAPVIRQQNIVTQENPEQQGREPGED